MAVTPVAPVIGPAQPGLELGDGKVQRGVPVVGRRLRADRRYAVRNPELDPLTAAGLARIAFQGYLHIDPDQLLIQFLDLRELDGRLLTEPLRYTSAATFEDDIHSGPPSELHETAAPARPTWSSSPHPPAEGLAAFLLPLMPCSRPGACLLRPRGRTHF